MTDQTFQTTDDWWNIQTNDDWEVFWTTDDWWNIQTTDENSDDWRSIHILIELTTNLVDSIQFNSIHFAFNYGCGSSLYSPKLSPLVLCVN